MWRESWIFVILIVLSLFCSISLVGQNTDCVTAQIICSDGTINFNPRGIGIDDFANPNNSFGCFELATAINDTSAENGSGWYYFEFREDMPPNSVIEFTITPLGGFGEDYDFLLFGPDVACDSLGEPVRCSFAPLVCEFCPSTGLGMGATDESEGVWFDEANLIYSDGFVAPLVVQPGEGFYLMLDNFARTTRGFTLEWGGSAAPYLNCNANPFCDNATVSAGTNFSVCEDVASFSLSGTIAGYSQNATVQWSGTPQAMDFLSDKSSLTPTVNIPDGFSGSLQYFLTVQEGNCTLADEVEVRVLPRENLQITGNTSICAGETTTLDAGNGFASYRWSNGDTTQMISVTTPGMYTVTVTNNNGCTSTDQAEVQMAAMPAPAISGGRVLCGNETTTLSLGTNYNTYRWSTGARTPSINISAAGTYRVTVTNANGCEGTAEITIQAFDNPTPQITGDDVFCFDQSTILRTSETYPAYAWSNNQTTPSVEILESGMVAVTVTDANGCQGSATLMVEEKAPLQAALSGDTVICAGEVSRLTVTPGLSYNWSTGATSPEIDVTASGTYQVTVVDADNCEAILSANITVDTLPEPVIQNPGGICQDATATLATDDIYSRYRWSNGDTNPSTQITTAGAYSLEVETSAGCIGTASVNVGAFPVVEPEIIGPEQFCIETGATLTTSENYPSFRWSNDQTTPEIAVATSGTFEVTVTDSNGCTGSDAITVQAVQIDFNTEPDTLGICPEATASLDVGADFPSYTWSTGETTRDITVNTGGEYRVTVANDLGCMASRLYVVEETNPPAVSIEGPRMLCPSDVISLQATPGFDEYAWSNGGTSDRIDVTQPGTYRLTVTASNGCSISTEFTVDGFFEAPNPTIFGDTSICDDSEISIRVSENYLAYEWSNGLNGQEITINSSGNYEVTVTDENGCRGTATTSIAQKSSPEVEIIGEDRYCEGLMTTLRATGEFPAYNWSNGAQGDSITVMMPGVYSVTVSDGTCTASDSLLVREIPLPAVDAGEDKTLDCNITSVTLGETVSTDTLDFEWMFNDTFFSNEANPEVSEAGDYTLTVIDKIYGCRSVESSVRVFDKAYTPKILLQTTGLLSCEASSVVIDASESLMGDKIIYTWIDNNGRKIEGVNSDQLTVREPGFYVLQVEDSQYGCKAIDSVEIKASFDFPVANAGADQKLTCNDNSVTLDGSASSDGLEFSYRWTTISGNIVADNVTKTPVVTRSGAYVLIVENEQNKCVSRDTVFVFEDRTPPVANAGQDQLLNCTVKEVTLTGNGDSDKGEVSYQWQAENGYQFADERQPVVNTTEPGTYRLIVTDLTNGCTADDTVTVLDISNPPRRVEATLVDPICRGDRNGKIIFDQVVGGTGPYFFSLDGKPFEYVEQFGGLEAGRYKITVEDVEGCQYETAFELNEGFLLEVDLGDSKNIKITDRAFLSPKVNVPRREIIELNWIEGLDLSCYDDCWEQYVGPFESTLYRVQVEDRNGCKATDDVMVFVNNSEDIFVPNGFSPNADGINDRLVVYAGGAIDYIKTFRVLSRWGGLVYESNGFSPNDAAYGWDGRYNGTMLDPGVFAYFVEVKYVDGRTALFSGDVTLVR